MKILLLGPNSIKFYTHNLGATRRLEMQKLSAEGKHGVWCRRLGEGNGRSGVQGVGAEVEWGWGAGSVGGLRGRSPRATKRAAEGEPCS